MVDFADANDAVGLNISIENWISLSDVHAAFISLHVYASDLRLLSGFEHVDVVSYQVDLFCPGDATCVYVRVRLLKGYLLMIAVNALGFIHDEGTA